MHVVLPQAYPVAVARTEMPTIAGADLDSYVANRVGRPVTPGSIIGGASIKVSYQDPGTYLVKLRLVTRAPYDGSHWRAWLSWGNWGNRSRHEFRVEGPIRYWPGPAVVPGLDEMPGSRYR